MAHTFTTQAQAKFERDMAEDWKTVVPTAIAEYRDYCNDAYLTVHPVQAQDIYDHGEFLMAQVDWYYTNIDLGFTWVDYFREMIGGYEYDVPKVFKAYVALKEAHEFVTM